MKTAVLFPVLSLAALCAFQELSTRYEPEHAVRVTSAMHLELESSMQMLRDGQPVEGRGGGMGGPSSDTRKSAHVDRYLACADGKPTKVRRTFESAEGEVETQRQGETQATSLESPFDGVVVEIEADEGGELSHKVVEGSDPGQEAIEKLRPELALDGLLPAGAVEEGGTWTLEGTAIAHALGFDLSDVMFRRPETEEGAGGGQGGGGRGGRGGGRGFNFGMRQLTGAEWTGKATYKGESDRDGVRCALIALEIEGESQSDDEMGSRSFEAKLTGELYVALDAHRPVALELEGEVQGESDSEREREGVVTEVHSESKGTFKLTCSVADAAFAE